MTACFNNKRKFFTEFPIEIQQLHPLRPIPHDTIPKENYRDNNQYLLVPLPVWLYETHNCVWQQQL